MSPAAPPQAGDDAASRAAWILSRCDDEQRAAVTAGAGPVLVVAGAGTGKTRSVVHRIAYRVTTGDVRAAHVLAVTHSTKAAGELRDRLIALRVPGAARIAARTFHAAALLQLRHFWERTGRDGALSVLDDRYGAVRAALRRVVRSEPDAALVFDTAAEVAWAKTQLLAPPDYEPAAAAAGREVAIPASAVAQVYEEYERRKQRAGAVDFEDMLALTAELVLHDGEVAAEVRDRYRSFVVDEYQDTDPLQQRLLDAWLGERSDITVVGDDRQCIYAFKGAQVKFMHEFPTRFPGTTVVRLVRDYRSTPQVVDVANRLMRTPPAEALVGMAAPGPRPRSVVFADEAQETAWVSEQVRRMLAEGTPPEQVAVLYRFNAQSAPLEQAFTTAGIPYTVADRERFFDRPEIVQVLTRLRRRAVDGSAEDGLDALGDVLEQVGFDADDPPSGAGAVRDRWESLAALAALVRDLPADLRATTDALLAELATRRAEAHGAATGTVTLATLHKAKGLEWDVVVLPRWVEGSLPSAYATSDEALLDERRLAYVGLTRARRHVLVTLSRSRAGRGRTQQPSRFLALAGLQPDGSGADVVRGGRARSERRRTAQPSHGTCAACGAPLTAAALVRLRHCAEHLEAPVAALVDELRRWRSEQARSHGRPAFTFFTDATMYELADRRPGSAAALLGVHGMGPAKVRDYGEELLRLIRAASH